MCDEAAITRWARQGLNRRQFGAMSGMAAVAACAPVGEGNPAEESDGMISLPAMREQTVTFPTQDGTMDAFWVVPATNPVPAVILWPDIAGLREAKRNMARRLAGRGFAVLVLNPYYRDVAGEIWTDFADFAGNGGWPKARAMREKHTPEAIMGDARAAVAWLDAQKEVDTARGIGTQGYCMGGPFTVWSAAAAPGRVKAAASFHGGGLVREDTDKSPHRLMTGSQSHYLIAIAKNDDEKAPEEKAILTTAAASAGSSSSVKVYAGDHGWTVPDSPAYNEAAAEEAWADLLALYRVL